MRNKIIFGISILGVCAGLIAAYVLSLQRASLPPVFQPATSPYAAAIFANGIIESDQLSGSDINIYPEVAGPVTQVLVHEGQQILAGTPLLCIDDSVQKATTEQLRLQAEASLSLLMELKAQPRPENLAITEAQVVVAESNLKVAKDTYAKRYAIHLTAPSAISQDELDSDKDAASQSQAALDLANRQNDLTKAGAWTYDIANQQKQYAGLKQAYDAANALLVKYTVKANRDGVVLSVNATVGSYVSSQGAYDTYTQGSDPLVVMGTPQDYLAVRCYVDEILVSRLPAQDRMQAQMSIRGSDTKIPLEFVRVQPYVSPKIELSDERQEQVDLRVLPVIFRFKKNNLTVYPGQEVDVYISQSDLPAKSSPQAISTAQTVTVGATIPPHRDVPNLDPSTAESEPTNTSKTP